MTTTDENLRGFLQREQPRLVRTLSSYTGDRDLAEELAAEALARMVRDWDTVSAMAAPGAYAHRTAVNMANSWFRRQAAHRRALARKGPADVVHMDPDIVAATAVREAVAALPRQQRAAVALHHLAGFTTAEVAEQLGVAPGTVRSNLHHARRSLRETLGDDAELSPAIVEPKVPREEVVARGTRLARRRTAATTAVVLLVVAAAVAVVVASAQEPEQPIVDEPPQDIEQPQQDTPPDPRPELDATELEPNGWHSLSADEARSVVDHVLPVPTADEPSSAAWDGTVSVNPVDGDGDGEVDLYRTSYTLTPVAGETDAAGHGNITVTIAPTAAPGQPEELATGDTVEIAPGRTGYATSGSSGAGLNWWQDDVVVQMSGPDLDQLIAVARSMT